MKFQDTGPYKCTFQNSVLLADVEGRILHTGTPQLNIYRTVGLKHEYEISMCFPEI